MSKNEAHPNHIHSCNEATVEFSKHVKSFTEIYSAEEFASIYDFFVLHAPVLKNGESEENQFGQRSLKYYRWSGNTQLSKLERELLKTAMLPNFIILRSDTINETLQSMKLKDMGCSIHPRAVLLQKHTLKILENGKLQIDGETRMECLFRHVRNSLAHNRTFSFPNSMIMLQDEDESNKTITARLLIPRDALIQWKKVILREGMPTVVTEDAGEIGSAIT